MRILVAFIITLVVYALLLWFYFTHLASIKSIQRSVPDEHIIKIDIRNFQTPIVQKDKSQIATKHPIRSQKTENKEPQKPKKNRTKKFSNRVKPTEKKSGKKVKNPKKRVKKTTIIPPSEMIFIANPLMLNSSKEDHPTQSSKITPSPKIRKLYGESFNRFSVAQQKFIVDKLDEIHRITQQTLSYRGYPSGALAAKTGQEGTNIVSFDLHPNGDISNLRLLRKVGYRALDENTLETIRTAYKDYPYPQEKTKIIFYVEYSIFGY